MIYHNLSGLHVIHQTAFAENDVLNDGCVRENHLHHIALFRQILIASGGRTFGHQFRNDLLVQVGYHDIQTCFYHVFCHGTSHDSQSNKSYFHCVFPPVDVSCFGLKKQYRLQP